MSDLNEPGDLPPDLPPEYAEAYRRGYQHAYEHGADPEEEQQVTEQHPAGGAPAMSRASQNGRAPAEPEATTRLGLDDLFGNAPSEPTAADRPVSTPRERPRWLVSAALAAMALLLIVGAYVVGRVFSSSVATGSAGSGTLVMHSPTASQSQNGSATQAPGEDYTGETDLATVSSASASCESPPAYDAGGNKVTYSATNVFDQDISTAWRCNGDGHGDQLTLTLKGTVPIGEVGLVPGYAKTDPYDGSDRYAENDRITKVRWSFDGGHSVVQKLDGSVDNRSMQTTRIPVTRAHTITMTILATTPGPRHTVAVSEVRIGRVAG